MAVTRDRGTLLAASLTMCLVVLSAVVVAMLFSFGPILLVLGPAVFAVGVYVRTWWYPIVQALPLLVLVPGFLVVEKQLWWDDPINAIEIAVEANLACVAIALVASLIGRGIAE